MTNSSALSGIVKMEMERLNMDKGFVSDNIIVTERYLVLET